MCFRVECHLIGSLRSTRRIEEIRVELARLDLEIQFHQGWSRATGQRNFHNRVLSLLGQLVPTGMSLSEQLKDVRNDPVVVYGNHVRGDSPPNHLYQTASEHMRGTEFPMTFSTFIRHVQSTGVPIVFDTQHVLEWSLNRHSVKGLPTTKKVLVALVEYLWRELHPFVKEIHLCDFDPMRGRNLVLGDGIFPLDAFSSMVKKTRWSGVVCPEVHPRLITSLPVLRARVAGLFE